jgi:hypothetical protein
VARTSRSERRFQSCASVARLYAPVRLVTPIEVIRAIQAIRRVMGDASDVQGPAGGASRSRLLGGYVEIMLAGNDLEAAREKRALYVVAVTFFLLAVYIIYEGLTGLFNSEEPLTSPIGIALSLSSLVIMPILAYAKQRTGKQMGSRALVADSKETWVCSYLSLALLIGVGAYALFGWWWVDSLAALVMLPVIVWQGWETLAEAREHGDSD